MKKFAPSIGKTSCNVYCCWEASCVRLVTKNPNSPNLGRAYLICSQKLPCDFFQWVNRPWSKYVLEVRRRFLRMPGIHSIFWSPENEWPKPDRQVAVTESPRPPQSLIVHGETCEDSCVGSCVRCDLDNRKMLRTHCVASFISR